jgi:uncharacterized protein YwgA
MATLDENKLIRLNYFYREVFNSDINMDSLGNRIKLQKLFFLLKIHGIRSDSSFSWWRYGPYSPRLAELGYSFQDQKQKLKGAYSPTEDESKIIHKLCKGSNIIKDVDKAELIASYLYLQRRLPGKSKEELTVELSIRKPRFDAKQIEKVMNEWTKTVN